MRNVELEALIDVVFSMVRTYVKDFDLPMKLLRISDSHDCVYFNINPDEYYTLYCGDPRLGYVLEYNIRNYAGDYLGEGTFPFESLQDLRNIITRFFTNKVLSNYKDKKGVE